MQRTDQAERFLERLASVPLTWENVFRSPQYTVNSDKEVVDLLLALRGRGILVSMKCQQDPKTRTGDTLVRWVQKSTKAALRQVGGGIRTFKTREFWCSHQRRGQVSFKPNQIEPVRAVVIVETLEAVALNQDIPLEVDSVPISYLSVNDFLNILIELRTINDLILYLEARNAICSRLQRTVGIEKHIFEFYVLYGGSPCEVASLQDILEEIGEHKTEVKSLIRKRKIANLQAKPIEHLSDRLSTRLESYEDGLDEELVRLFDPDLKRSNYLMIQDELCDLVLDERRKLGASLSGAVEKVKEEDSNEPMVYQAAYLDSKPDFLYVLSSSKGFSRNEVIKRCCELLQGGLAYYGKTRGLAVNYTQNLESYEAVMINSFKETPESMRLGKECFSNLKMSDIPMEKV